MLFGGNGQLFVLQGSALMLVAPFTQVLMNVPDGLSLRLKILRQLLTQRRFASAFCA